MNLMRKEGFNMFFNEQVREYIVPKDLDDIDINGIINSKEHVGIVDLIKFLTKEFRDNPPKTKSKFYYDLSVGDNKGFILEGFVNDKGGSALLATYQNPEDGIGDIYILSHNSDFNEVPENIKLPLNHIMTTEIDDLFLVVIQDSLRCCSVDNSILSTS